MTWLTLCPNIVENMNGEQEIQVPGPYFQVPGHTPVIFSEVGRGKTLFRLLCRDAGGETEQMLLTDTVPGWVVDVLVHVSSCILSSEKHVREMYTALI